MTRFINLLIFISIGKEITLIFSLIQFENSDESDWNFPFDIHGGVSYIPRGLRISHGGVTEKKGAGGNWFLFSEGVFLSPGCKFILYLE